ncbi:MAG: hypothetical protein J4O04_03310 [Chloroflexi bacterium]|nr:hypothetical protein [Chloroflexota bacterium]
MVTRLSSAAVPLAIAVMITTVVLSACGGDGDDQPVLADVTPQPGRQPTHTPPPTLITSTTTAATLVFIRDDDLWVAPLDGSGKPRAITSASIGARYAGYALRPDGGIDLFYLSQLEENRELFDEVEFGVFRVGLEGGDSEELFRFSSDSAHLVGADVAADGLRIVYADVDALILRDLDSGEETILARSRWILAGDGSYIRTDMLTSPIWSPTGERVYSSMFAGPDTVVSVIIDLPPRPITVVDIRYPGHRGSWSPDGSQLCLTSGDIYDGGLTLYDVTTHDQIDVLAGGMLPDRIEGEKSSVAGCAWSEDGRLAVGYTPIEREPHRVFILDEQLALVDQSELYTPSPGVIDWLPDGSGVVVSRRNTDGESFSAGIYRPGGGIEYLPFEADRVVAVIP